MKRLLKGGRVVDPASGLDDSADVLIDGDRIARIDRAIPASEADGGHVMDVPHDTILCPGFIDMHAHLREPGQEHKETVATGTAAALAGGFTAVACMPNTDPVNDNASVTRLILQRAAEAGNARVYPIGAVTVGQKGELLAGIGELREAGCVAISDDGRPVSSSLLMRRALEYAGMFGMTVIDHCEDRSLAGDGVAHEGFHASMLGLRGIPSAAEEVMVHRDLILAQLTGASVHIAHLSTAGSLLAVGEAKKRGIKVTCEVTPHHFTLTDELLAAPLSYDTNVKMNPPLRAAADRDALLEGIAAGLVDVIATDHAPHHYDEKLVEFDRAPFGIIGLETAVSLALDRLVNTGRIGLSRLVELFSLNPARILGVPGGRLAPGAAADLTVLVPAAEVKVDPSRFRSRSRNTPFAGWTLRGGVAATIVAGKTLYVNPELPSALVFHGGQPAGGNR
jgi:dihydroorotase